MYPKLCSRHKNEMTMENLFSFARKYCAYYFYLMFNQYQICSSLIPQSRKFPAIIQFIFRKSLVWIKVLNFRNSQRFSFCAKLDTPNLFKKFGKVYL